MRRCFMILNSFLDEPTIGVDVVSKKYLHDFISEINREKGTTVLLTTHNMGDIEKLCSRVVVIDSGHLMYDGDLEYGAKVWRYPFTDDRI